MDKGFCDPKIINGEFYCSHFFYYDFLNINNEKYEDILEWLDHLQIKIENNQIEIIPYDYYATKKQEMLFDEFINDLQSYINCIELI